MTAQPDNSPAAEDDHTQHGTAIWVYGECEQCAEEVAERHKGHGHAEYPQFCPLCRDDQDEWQADIEADHAAEIDGLTCTLALAADDAERVIAQALGALTELVSDRVYDIELAEGSDGADAKAELEAAARAIRHVKRIAAHRREVLLAADPLMNPQAAQQ
jgi:hypothetical protein